MSGRQAANVFTFSDLVKTSYTAVKINIAAGGSVTVDTTDKRFASTTFRSYPIKDYLVALNYASVATCAPLTAPGTGAHRYATVMLPGHLQGRVSSYWFVACMARCNVAGVGVGAGVNALLTHCRCCRSDWDGLHHQA